MKPPPAPADTASDIPEPIFFNRDLSWLEFNRRVLAQAADESLPLLERCRFVAIFTTNLDEFFMKRVGIIKRQVHAGIDAPGPDGLRPRQQLQAIRALVGELEAEQTRIYQSLLLPALAASGIDIVSYKSLTSRERTWADQWYKAHIFPALTPLAVDPTHRFPFISNLSDNLAVVATFPGASDEDRLYARVKIPPNIKRFIPLPSRGDTRARFLLLPELVRHNLAGLFPGMTLHAHVFFRVTRMAGIQRDDLETINMLQSVEEDLKARRFARAVRLEIEPDASPVLQRWLIDKLSLEPQDVYEQTGDAEYAHLGELSSLDRPDLKFGPWKPVPPRRLAPEPGTPRTPAQLFAQLRKHDVLVHHPYESFQASAERFIAAAAADPDVLTIKQTLYRTSPDSPFVENLVRAAESGKQVACLVEVRARFDEGRNVRFARQLEKAGVHVAYGVMGLKTHCKTSLVVRKEAKGLRCYAHLGTGNYNPKTAQLYTDVSLLTADPAITGELVTLFNFLTGLSAEQNYAHLLIAPFNMRREFYARIARESDNARKGRPAYIFAKINALEDREITQRLYDASQAGVSIDLVVRGFCCLRPGVPGLSDNIRVHSVIGRFLEHSRIFHFAAGHADPAEGDWFISSADWMYRNLSNRVEAAVPVRDPDARAQLCQIREVMLADRHNAWTLNPDGSYTRRSAPNPDEGPGTFATLMHAALRNGSDA